MTVSVRKTRCRPVDCTINVSSEENMLLGSQRKQSTDTGSSRERRNGTGDGNLWSWSMSHFRTSRILPKEGRENGTRSHIIYIMEVRESSPGILSHPSNTVECA